MNKTQNTAGETLGGVTAKTEVKQHQSFFNPLFLDGREINHFVFFDRERGTTLLEPTNENVRWFKNGGSNNDYPSIIFDFEIKRKNVIDLTSKKAFYSKYESKYNFDKGKIVVYIPIQLLKDFTVDKKVFQFETATDKNYLDIFTFKTMAVKKARKLNEDGSGVTYFNTELSEEVIKFHGYYISEPTDFGAQVNEVEEVLKSNGVKVSSYDLEKIMNLYTLTKK
jgi:hypothetical protein